MIGTKSSASFDFWQGDIDEVRIYKRALSAAEAAALYKPSYTTATLPTGTNVITWKVTDNSGSSASAIQVVNVLSSNAKAPVTSSASSGNKYVDSTSGNTFVTSTTAFNLSVESSTTVKGTYFRYFKPSDTIRPSFSSGTYFKIGTGDNSKYSVQFYSVNSDARESLHQIDVILDNLPPTTSLSVIDSTAGKIRLTASDNSGGSGVGGRSNSGIYYKLDSAASYTFVKSKTVELTNVANAAHTIYYYSIDNLENKEDIKSKKFIVTYTFCSSGCKYNNLQTAISAIPAGGKVYVKDGSYTISTTMSLKSNMILEFSSGSSIYFTGDGTTLFKGSSISNVQIIGGDITAKLNGVDALPFYSSKGIKLTGTQVQLIKGDSSSAFYCNNCINVSISDVDFSSATRLIDIKQGAKVTDGKSSDIWIQNSRFEDSSAECVKVNYSTHVHIIGNDVTDCADNGIDIGSNLDTEIRDNTITRAGMPNGVAIHTDGANDADIIYNHIDSTGKAGISVYRASHINVIGNTLKNTGTIGINMISSEEPSSYIKVKSNQIIAPGSHGVYESPNQNQVEISYNKFQQIPPDKKAVYVVSPNPTTTVTGNTIS